MQLLSGLQIADVNAALKDLEKNHPYFDAVPVREDSQLCIRDITLQMMLNSRISGNTASLIFDGRAAVETALAQIPAHLDLIDVNDPVAETWLAPLIGAVSYLVDIKWVNVATATKTLHKKRPGLVPMFDSMVGGYYRSVIGRPENFRQMYLCFHKDLTNKDATEDRLTAQDLRQFVVQLRSTGIAVTHCRLLDYLVWFERRRLLGKGPKNP